MLVKKHDTIQLGKCCKKNWIFWLEGDQNYVSQKNGLPWIKNDPLNCFKITTTKTLTVVWSQNCNIMKILHTFGKYLKGINNWKGGWNSPKCRTGERDGDWEFLFGTDAAEFTEHCAKDQGGSKLGNTHRHIMLVEKIMQGRSSQQAGVFNNK